MKDYYNIPVNAGLLIEKTKHPKCDIRESVQFKYLNMIIRTRFREYRFDPMYRCFICGTRITAQLQIFQNGSMNCKTRFSRQSERNEPRISKTEIKIDLEEAEIFERYKGQPLRLKHKLTIEIRAIITHLNEPFEHLEFMFFQSIIGSLNLMDIKENKKEVVQSRLKRNAARYWGYRGLSETEGFDPVIDMLFGACSVEFEHLSTAIQVSRSRILGKK